MEFEAIRFSIKKLTNILFNLNAYQTSSIKFAEYLYQTKSHRTFSNGTTLTNDLIWKLFLYCFDISLFVRLLAMAFTFHFDQISFYTKYDPSLVMLAKHLYIINQYTALNAISCVAFAFYIDYMLYVKLDNYSLALIYDLVVLNKQGFVQNNNNNLNWKLVVKDNTCNAFGLKWFQMYKNGIKMLRNVWNSKNRNQLKGKFKHFSELTVNCRAKVFVFNELFDRVFQAIIILIGK